MRKVLGVLTAASIGLLCVVPTAAAAAPPVVAQPAIEQALDVGASNHSDQVLGALLKGDGVAPLSDQQMAEVHGDFQFTTFVGGLGAMGLGALSFGEGVQTGNVWLMRRGVVEFTGGFAAAIYGATH